MRSSKRGSRAASARSRIFAIRHRRAVVRRHRAAHADRDDAVADAGEFEHRTAYLRALDAIRFRPVQGAEADFVRHASRLGDQPGRDGFALSIGKGVEQEIACSHSLRRNGFSHSAHVEKWRSSPGSITGRSGKTGAGAAPLTSTAAATGTRVATICAMSPPIEWPTSTDLRIVRRLRDGLRGNRQFLAAKRVVGIPAA